MENPFDILKFKSTLKSADASTIKKFKGIMPEFVLKEWEQRGFANYMNGLFITTNPEDYYGMIDGWVKDPKNCHVLLRTAFGNFYYLKDGEFYYVDVIYNTVNNKRNDFEVIIEFSIDNKGNLDDIFFKDIYDKAEKKLGPPGYDEVYAFAPILSMGGNPDPKKVHKVKLKEHLAILS